MSSLIEKLTPIHRPLRDRVLDHGTAHVVGSSVNTSR